VLLDPQSGAFSRFNVRSEPGRSRSERTLKREHLGRTPFYVVNEVANSRANAEELLTSRFYLTYYSVVFAYSKLLKVLDEY